jgi:predicted esterase
MAQGHAPQGGPVHPRFTHDQVVTRRRILAGGVAVLLGAVAGVEIYDHRGNTTADQFDPVCWVDDRCGGVNVSGVFASRYRGCEVGYTVGYPNGHAPGSRLPLVIFLHGFGGSHTRALSGMTPAQAVSLRPGGTTLTPMALVTVDGGGGYWHPHPGDDPMGMVIHELIPMLQARGLGVPPHRIATMGISMGGYGAIIFAEHYPQLFCAVAAISPAIFTTYAWVHYVNPGAYWSAADFARYDALTHVGTLGDIPVRVASGNHDPFHPWVEEFVALLPPGDPVIFPPGGHDGGFFSAQEPPSLAFLSRYLA